MGSAEIIIYVLRPFSWCYGEWIHNILREVSENVLLYPGKDPHSSDHGAENNIIEDLLRSANHNNKI